MLEQTKEMMVDCLTKEMKMLSSMEAVMEGKGLSLKTPYENDIRNMNSELKIHNIHNHKKVTIEDDGKSDQEQERQELRRTQLADDRN